MSAKEFDKLSPYSHQNSSAPALTVSNLRKRYGKFMAVDDVSFTVERGSTVLMLGPNGAGKTTIIKCIMGLLNFRGKISVEGIDVGKDGRLARERIGYVPQQSAYYENLTVGDEAKLVARLKKTDGREIEDALRIVNLWDVRNRRVKSLSSGMRQRLGIGLAMLSNPEFLIFDEPTSNVDLKGQLDFQSLLKTFSQQGKTLLICTHLSGLDKFAGKVIILDSGRIIANGSPAELLGRINAVDTVFVKLRDADFERASEAIRGVVGEVTRQDNWLSFSVVPEKKGDVLRAIMEGGSRIEDLVIEPSAIESEYLRLLKKGTGN